MQNRALDTPRLRRLLETVALSDECFLSDFPTLCQDALRKAMGLPVASPELDRALSGLRRIDSQRPSWQAKAVALLAEGAASTQPLFRRAAVLLSLRAVGKPDPIVESVERPGGEKATGCRLISLLNTDTTATLPMWHRLLARRCEGSAVEPPEEPDPPLFISFVKCLQHRLVEYDLFERAAPAAMSPLHDGGRRARPPFFHPVLDYLGLTSSGYFRLMYGSLLNSLVFDEPDPSWDRIAWVRRFPGERYMLDALRRLSSDPTDPAALHVARWAYDLEGTRAAFGSKLGAFRPATVMLLSMVRRDMDEAVSAALAEPSHKKAARWLRQGPFVAFEQAASDPGPLAAWCARWAPAWEEALGSIMRVRTPTEEEPLQFARRCLAPDLRRLFESLSFVWALGGMRPDLLRQRAEAGSQSAILALGLAQPPGEGAVELLLSLRRRAIRPQAQAVDAALAQISRQSPEGASAAQEAPAQPPHDAGLEGHQARVWPDIAGWAVKLSVSQGKPEVAAYGPKGRAGDLPREVRQHPLFEQVKDAQARLSRQHRDFREKLEGAMVCQRSFSAAEFEGLRANALFAEMSDRLVIESGGHLSLGWQAGRADRVRIAHPVSLSLEGILTEWQQRLAKSGLTQPFKQCFRELYIAEESEMHAPRCARFAGHRVLARSAFALLRARGWTPASGCAYKDWPERAIRARMVWADGVANVGRYILGPGRLQPVVTGHAYFRKLSEDGAESTDDIPIGSVAPVILSETLRDADLLVSRAAAGDMNRGPREARALRASLLRQFAREHGLRSIAVGADNTYAIVHSAEEFYRVHLGSGSVFTEPEGRHVPMPPPAPRPHLLPLEECDSRTARIIATVLSLAAREGA